MWEDVNLRTDTKNTFFLKEIGLHAQKMLTINWEEHENVHFDNTSKNYEANAMGTIWIC